jgi:hypothetical protein
MTAPAVGGGVPSNDWIAGTAIVVGVGVGGTTVVRREAAIVENSEAGTGVATERDGVAEAVREGTGVGTDVADGILQPVKIKTIKRTKRETGTFLMIEFSNDPYALLRLMVELECPVFGS